MGITAKVLDCQPYFINKIESDFKNYISAKHNKSKQLSKLKNKLIKNISQNAYDYNRLRMAYFNLMLDVKPQDEKDVKNIFEVACKKSKRATHLDMRPFSFSENIEALLDYCGDKDVQTNKSLTEVKKWIVNKIEQCLEDDEENIIDGDIIFKFSFCSIRKPDMLELLRKAFSDNGFPLTLKMTLNKYDDITIALDTLKRLAGSDINTLKLAGSYAKDPDVKQFKDLITNIEIIEPKVESDLDSEYESDSSEVEFEEAIFRQNRTYTPKTSSVKARTVVEKDKIVINQRP